MMNQDAATRFVRTFLNALERFDAETIGTLLANDVVHVEHPNALVPSGLTRNKEAMLRGLASGRATLSAQTYELTNLVASGDAIAFECIWRGTLAVALGSKSPGDVMTARFAVFLRLERGQVKTWNNYDCFDPF